MAEGACRFSALLQMRSIINYWMVGQYRGYARCQSHFVNPPDFPFDNHIIEDKMMTPDQKTLVQESFICITPIADTAAKLFYQKLFELDPQLMPLFKGDMEEQGKKLMQMIAAAINALDRLDEIVPAVQALGERHAGYGVTDKDYDTVGQALLWTLEQGLDNLYTPEVEEAWLVVYTMLADTMKSAAAKAA